MCVCMCIYTCKLLWFESQFHNFGVMTHELLGLIMIELVSQHSWSSTETEISCEKVWHNLVPWRTVGLGNESVWQWCDLGEVTLCVAYNHQAYRQFIVPKHQSWGFTDRFNIGVGVLSVLLLGGFVLILFVLKQSYQIVQCSEPTTS